MMVVGGKAASTIYKCQEFAQQLQDAFGITIDAEEDPTTFPSCFCSCCKRTMDKRITAAAQGVPQRCSTVTFQWSNPVTRIAWHIDSISPLSLNALGTQPPSVSDNNNLPVLDHLRDMKASDYQGHICELSPTQEVMRSASLILQRAASLSPEQPVLKFSTGGAVTLTVKQRCRELDAIRSIVSGGEPSALGQEELRSYPCLCCHIPNDQMNTALHARGYASKRSLETIQKGLEGFMANGGKKRTAKQHYNCISDPIFNIPITQVCLPGLHSTLGIFTKMFHLLEDMCQKYDLQLAAASCEATGTSKVFQKYMDDLRTLQSSQAELACAQESLIILEQITTYSVVKFGESTPLTCNLMQQCSDKRDKMTQLEKSIQGLKVHLEKGFPYKEGPIVKALDDALQSFSVQRQQYFGGAFTGNHVHKTLKESNIEAFAIP
eukprot:Em0007g508a